MRKIFILMFCMIILIGNVTALELRDIDDIKRYDEQTKTYSLENFFGLGKTIADLELKTPQNFEVPSGYQKVAEVEIRNGEFDYGEIINGIKLYDIKDGLKEFVRSVDYKYKTIVQVPIYHTVCDKALSENGTLENVNCRQEQVGLKDKVVWEDFTRNSLLKGEIITLGIFTEVEKGDQVEWIINVYGNEKLTAWAVWTESLDVGLVSYYALNQTSGVVIDSVAGVNNGTNTGSTRGVPGIINNSFSFDGNDDVNMGNDTSLNFGSGDFAFSLWVNYSGLQTGILVMKGATGPGGKRYRILLDIGNIQIEIDDDTTGKSVTSASTFGDGVFHHVVGVRDGNNLRLYIDNVEETPTNITGYGSLDDLINPFTLAKSSHASSVFLTGNLDEIGVWNRSLSSSEVSDLFNGGLGLNFFDRTTTTVTLNSPIDNFATTNQTVIFNGTVISTSADLIVNVSLILDGVINETNSSGINNTDYIFTLTLPFADYNWTYESCNNESQCIIASVRDFSVVTFIENNVTFNENVLETTSQDFELNISTISSILSISAFLNYNGTRDVSTTVCDGLDCTITNTIDIPLVTSGESENKSFFWEISAFDGTTSVSTNTTTQQQNVTRIHLEECGGAFTTQAMNFTAHDEQNLSRIDPFLFAATFDQWLGSGSVKRQNNFSQLSTSDETLCILPDDETFFIDDIIEYDEAGNQSLYTLRNYFFQNDTINNVSVDTFLFLLLASDSTSFILKVQDDSLLPLANHLIEINRFYPGTNEFRIVQIARTDDLGKSVGFFETEIVDYKFLITFNNVTLLETGLQKVIPETSPFTLTFNVGDPLGEPWKTQDEITNLNSSLLLNDSGGIITYEYIDTSNNFDLARLFVIRQSLVNQTNDTIICNENSSLTSAILTCNVSDTAGFYVASAFITRFSFEELDLQINFQIETLSSVVGLLGLFFGWFLVLIASFMFKFNEIAGIWAVTITMFLINLIGLINFGGVFVTATIAIAIILTWIMER